MAGEPRESDIEVVYRRGDWHSWHDAIEWLRTDGMDDGELSADSAARLVQHLECLEHDGVAFTRDPRFALLLVKSHC